MTEPDMAFIRAEIDQEKGRPLDRKSIIPLFNEYILRVCNIQNSFISRLEDSFAKLENRLDRAETLVCLLEHRLERVEVENKVSNINVEILKSEPVEEIPSTSTLIDILQPTSESVVEPIVESSDNSMMKIRDHPVYEKYFKMLRLGIPEQAVKIKMTTEGIDSLLLSNPDKLIEAVKLQNSSSDSEKTDSD